MRQRITEIVGEFTGALACGGRLIAFIVLAFLIVALVAWLVGYRVEFVR